MNTALSPSPDAQAQAPGAKPAQPHSGPWWRYGHMWLVVGGPLVVVIAGVITMYLAASGADRVYSEADLQASRAAAAASPALAPAMQARNHAATGGLAAPAASAASAASQP